VYDTLSSPLEELSENGNVSFLALGLHNHVIYINLYLFMHHIMQQGLGHSLISSPTLLGRRASRPPLHDESGFVLIFFGHFNLVISNIAIHE